MTNPANKRPLWTVVRTTIKNHLFLSLALLVAVIGAVAAGIIPPLVLEEMVNQLTGGHVLPWHLILWYFGTLVISGLFDTAKEALITVFGHRATHQLRSEMAEKLTRLPAQYYVENEAGVISSKFVNGVDAVETLFTSGIISMVVDAGKVISVLAMIFVKSKGLGILMIIVTPILFVITMIFQKKMLAAQVRNRKAVGKVNQHVPDTIDNIRMIRSIHCEGFLKKRYRIYIQEESDALGESNFYDAIYSPIIVTMSAVVVAVMMICASLDGDMEQFFGMTVGTAVAVISYVSKVFDPLENIGMEIQSIQAAMAGIHLIHEYFAQPERKIVDNIISLDYSKPAISFSQVHFGYTKDQEVISGFSFCVERGEQVTLTGRTGAGKSTMFKLILGLYTPWSGNIALYGVPVEQFSDRERAKILGYVEQNFAMVRGTVEDQITLKNTDISREDVWEALKLVGLDDEVTALEHGLDTICHEELFSQGQQQLLCIARAVVTNPEVLLLDEITANLDADTEQKVLNALEKASENRSVLSISHRGTGHSRIVHLN